MVLLKIITDFITSGLDCIFSQYFTDSEFFVIKAGCWGTTENLLTVAKKKFFFF
jgi:hypothetical protein